MSKVKAFQLINGQIIVGRTEAGGMVSYPVFLSVEPVNRGEEEPIAQPVMRNAIPFFEGDRISINNSSVIYSGDLTDQLVSLYEKAVMMIRQAKSGLILPQPPGGKILSIN